MQLTEQQIKEGWKLNEGVNPIKDGQEFEIMFAIGDVSLCKKGKALRWGFIDKDGDILAYRILSEEESIGSITYDFENKKVIVKEPNEPKIDDTFEAIKNAHLTLGKMLNAHINAVKAPKLEPNQVQALQSIIREKNEEITALKTELYFLRNKLNN